MREQDYFELMNRLKNSPYKEQRKSVGRQALESLVPIAALAAGAYALHKGVKWGAKDLILKNSSNWRATKDQLNNLYREGKGSVIHQIMERLK